MTMLRSVLPAGLVSLLRHRHLLWQLVCRDVASRYRGSAVGLTWSLLFPVIMLGVYLVVFGIIYRPAHVSGVDASFAMSLFAGLVTHGLLGECLARAPMSVVAQPSYVKKVVFPVELLPLTIVGTAVFQFLVGSAVLLAALAATSGLGAAAWLWPVTWIPLAVFAAGISLALAALTVYLRDVAQLTGFVSTVLLFLAPVFYPLQQAPASLRQLLMLNPLTVPIESGRALLIHNRMPDWHSWFVHAIACICVFACGWWFFRKARHGFADVI